MYDVIIIGCGPAGMTAAIYAKRANLNVLLLDKLAPGGQIINTFEIQNYTGMGTINGAELAIQMFQHTQELNVEFAYGTVNSIKEIGGSKLVSCEEGETYETKTVIIATGTVPRMLGIDNEITFAGNGISWCAICDGANYQGKDVIVIGGGNSAVEEAIYLADMVNNLTVVTLFDLTADASACEKLKAKGNVDIYEYYDITEFLPGDKFKGLRAKSTKNGDIIEVLADGAFEYIGLKPNGDSFKDLGILNEHGYIEADKDMKTSAPGVFAAGDIVAKGLRQIVTACNDGAIAAQSAKKYIETTII